MATVPPLQAVDKQLRGAGTSPRCCLRAGPCWPPSPGAATLVMSLLLLTQEAGVPRTPGRHPERTPGVLQPPASTARGAHDLPWGGGCGVRTAPERLPLCLPRILEPPACHVRTRLGPTAQPRLTLLLQSTEGLVACLRSRSQQGPQNSLSSLFGCMGSYLLHLGLR